MPKRLRHTPISDLVRGRITGRLDWRRAIATAGLPAPIAALITRVVRRTRLWRGERVDVAHELIAHFSDGFASGASVETLTRDFGDERQAAKLIRRAKRRNRSLRWHAQKWLGRAILVLIAIYALNLVRFLVGRPQVKVDYIARLNAVNSGVTPDQAAWPLYRQAMLELGLNEPVRDPSAPVTESEVETVSGIDSPHSAEWPRVVRWVDANQAGLELLRQAATKPKMGFVFGPGGSAEDAALGWAPHPPAADNPLRGSMIYVMLPQLNRGRTFANLLSNDFHVALDRGDASRAEQDYNAMLALADHLQAPIVVNALVAMGIDGLAFNALERALVQHPERFHDGTLVRLAHRTGRIGNGGDTASSLIDIAGERMAFHDAMQRIYTDDGEGDGRLTPAAVRAMAEIGTMYSARPGSKSQAEEAGEMLVAAGFALTKSRRDNEQAYDRLMSLTESAYAHPYREWDQITEGEPERTFAWIANSPLRAAHYLPLRTLTPSLSRAGQSAERTLARRDALTAAIAVELYRRQHGQYPPTLYALVPQMLPRVPQDRFDGGPMRYRVVDGSPVIYSVGPDGIDGGGQMPTDRHGRARPWNAALGEHMRTGLRPGEHDEFAGDWILFGKPLVEAADADLDEAAKQAAEDAAATQPATTEPAAQ